MTDFLIQKVFFYKERLVIKEVKLYVVVALLQSTITNLCFSNYFLLLQLNVFGL